MPPRKGTRPRRPSTDALAAAFHAAVAELFEFCAPDPTSGTVSVEQLLPALATAAPSVAEPYTAAVLALVVADAERAAEAFAMFADGAADGGGRVDVHQFTFAFHVGFGLLNAEAHVEALAGQCAAADATTLGVDAVLTALRSQSDTDPIAALWIEGPVASTRAATREIFFDVSGRRGVEGGVDTVDARRFVTVFRTALLKRRRLTAVLRTLFKALAADGSVSASESCVQLAAWQRFCARPGVPRVMGRLLCAATTNYTLRADELAEVFGASDVGAAAAAAAATSGAGGGGAAVEDPRAGEEGGGGGISWAAFRARLCEEARKQRESALGALLFRSLTSPAAPTRASSAAVRCALAQFPHVFCRAIGYSTARPHHHRPTYTLFEHSSFKYFGAKKAAESGFVAPLAAAQHLHAAAAAGAAEEDGDAAAAAADGAAALSLDDFLDALRASGDALVRRSGGASDDAGEGATEAYRGAGDGGGGGGAKQKTKHLAAMGASVYGKRRDGGQHHGRRSSKSAPGSSVALVLGGGLALIAVGGLLAYALVGGSSERKEGERASA
jgi:hypothetical protein